MIPTTVKTARQVIYNEAACCEQWHAHSGCHGHSTDDSAYHWSFGRVGLAAVVCSLDIDGCFSGRKEMSNIKVAAKMLNRIGQETDTRVRAMNTETEKKAGWFTRWFDRKCEDAWKRKQASQQLEVIGPSPVRMSEPQLDADGLNIRIYSATGGNIVEFRRYDMMKDRHHTKMYVISSEENFSEQFSKIVTMEMIR